MPTTINTHNAAIRYKPKGKLEYLPVSNSKNLKLRVTKAGSKDWVLRYSVQLSDNKRQFKYIVLGPCDDFLTLKGAREKAIIELARIEHQKLEAKSAKRFVEARGHTLSSLWELYIKQDAYQRNSPKTQYEKKNTWANFSSFMSPELPVADLTIDHLAEYMTAKAEGLLPTSRKDASKIGSNRDIGYLSPIFNWAVKRKFLAANPCIGLDMYIANSGWKSIPLELYDDVIKTLREWHLEFDHEKRDWKRNADGSLSYDPYKRRKAQFALFLLFTGMRKSEAQSLQYIKDQNENNYISFIASSRYNEQTGKSETINRYVATLRNHKTKKVVGTRTIALTDKAAELIELAPPYTLGRLKGRSKWVFPNRDGDGPISDSAITKLFTQLNQIYNDFTDFKVTPRSTRHTFARHCLSLGLSHDKLADILGHLGTDMIRRHYAKTDHRQVNAAVDDLSERISIKQTSE